MIQGGFIHIRIQQRSGRKTLTTVQGLSVYLDLKKILKEVKKAFACNGTVIDHKEYGEILQLQGDQRLKIRDWLKNTYFVNSKQIKMHGF